MIDTNPVLALPTFSAEPNDPERDLRIQTFTGLAPGAAHDRFGTKLPMIGTSDRILFRRCRRRWNWQSPMRGNLEAIGTPIEALWLGTGVHYALEDYHSHRTHGTAVAAFLAYLGAFRVAERPLDWRNAAQVGLGMLDYYERHWLPQRDEFQTLWVPDAAGVMVPQVEVNFLIPLPHAPGFYRGTFDRVVTDPFGRYWVLDYKTAKKHDTAKLPTDPQVTAYCWAATQIYGQQFEGVVYMQMLKTPPGPPTRLKNGTFSKAKTQATTYPIYRTALMEEYGHIPPDYQEFVDWLSNQETADGDAYIRRDLVRRNQAQLEAEGGKILAESLDMLNPELPLYPNPTFNCAFDCPFREPCIAMDDGSDWRHMLATGYVKRRELVDWRSRVEAGDIETLTVESVNESAVEFSIDWSNVETPPAWAFAN